MVLYIPGLPTLTEVDLVWSIIDRYGLEHDLTYQTSLTAFVPKGTKGLGYADVNLSLEKRPFARGSAVRHIATQPVQISLPIVLSLPTFQQLLVKVEQVRDWFYTGDERSQTPAYLKIQRPQDSTSRKIAFYYNGGLEGDLEQGSPTFVPLVVKLLCPDPDWLDTVDSEVVYPQANINGYINSVTNLGDVDAYPIFTWNGPGNNALLQNITTGKFISLTNGSGLFVGSGESVIIDTRPPSERTHLPVINTAGTSLYQYVLSTSDLHMWLVPGLNELYFLVQDTTGISTISMTYTQRYRGVLR